jgi:hypothetical protein
MMLIKDVSKIERFSVGMELQCQILLLNPHDLSPAETELALK